MAEYVLEFIVAVWGGIDVGRILFSMCADMCGH